MATLDSPTPAGNGDGKRTMIRAGVGSSDGGYEFKPQPDITLEELTEVVNIFQVFIAGLHGIVPPPAFAQYMRELPPEVKRHFSFHPQSTIVLARPDAPLPPGMLPKGPA